MIRLLFIFFTLFLFSCSKPAVNITACDGLNKVSKEYVKCLEDLVNCLQILYLILKSLVNIKQVSRFFKRVTVDPSN